jgi:hypothetical protein
MTPIPVESSSPSRLRPWHSIATSWPRISSTGIFSPIMTFSRRWPRWRRLPLGVSCS